MSGTSWIYAPKGKIPFYRERDYIYSTTGKAKYFVSDGWWYEIDDGVAKYWTRDNWAYTTSGKAAFPLVRLIRNSGSKSGQLRREIG